ncbi:MAG: hypothetical protein ACK5OC_23300 [Pirellula sp.]|jgi:hypothetical protein
MRESLRLPFLWCTVVLLLGSMGCDSGPKVAEVSGTITLNDGKPLELIHVEFWSEGGPRSWGKTDDSGKFTLKLDAEDSKDGAIVGKHKVLLRDTWPLKDNKLGEGGEWIDNSKGKKPRIHSKYYDEGATPLSFEVKAGEKNNFEIKCDPASK